MNERLKTEVAFVFRSIQKRALIERQFAGHVRHSEDDMCQKAIDANKSLPFELNRSVYIEKSRF